MLWQITESERDRNPIVFTAGKYTTDFKEVFVFLKIKHNQSVKT